MPERTSEKGAYRVDWARPEVGRVRKSYGFTKRQRDGFVDALDQLYNCDPPRLEELRAIQQGLITPRQVMEIKGQGNLLKNNLRDLLKLRLPLWDTIEQCIAERHGSAKHKARLRNSIAKLRASRMLRENAIVADLRSLTKSRLRPVFQSPADWNHARKAILTPLSQLFGDPLHPFRREVLKAIGPKEREPERPLDVTKEQFWALVNAMPERPDVRAGRGERYNPRHAVIGLATTGLRLNTEWYRAKSGDLRPAVPGIFCRGSKTADSLGIVHIAESLYPLVEDAIVNRCPAMTLRRHFVKARKKVGLDNLTLHDLRHLTAIFAFEGGAKLNEVQAMLRHSDVNMTSRYSRVRDRGQAAEAIGRALERPAERAD